MNPFSRSRRLARCSTLAFSVLFVLALAAAQPHRVHHFLEDIDHEHHHGNTESSHDDHSKPPRTECVVQAVSQHCSAIPVAIEKIILIATAGEAYRPVLRRWIYHFFSSPFLQRAPPPSGSSFNI